MNKFKSLMLAAAMIGLSSVTSYAATTPPGLINIQFGGGNSLQYVGPGVVGDRNDVWNKPTALPLYPAAVGEIPTNTKYADGSGLSGITFAYTADVVHNAAEQLTGFGSSTQKELMRSYISTSDGTPQTAYDIMDFGNLTAGASYKIWVLTQTEDVLGNNYGDGQLLKIQFVDAGFNNTVAWTQSILSDGAQTGYVLGQNYLYGIVQANTDGTIHMQYQSRTPLTTLAPMNNGSINGVQIATPEPASMLLIGVGGALMSAMKARKKKSAEKSIV
jgi:hypothetical protein